MATPQQIAAEFIGAAKKNPDARQEIFREAAYAFMGLAHDPKNARAQERLVKIGLDFAAAATREQPILSNDFRELLTETAEAFQVTHDPMELVAQRRQIYADRTPSGGGTGKAGAGGGAEGSVSIAPVSFNKDATLGRSAVIKWNPSSAEVTQGILQSQNVAFWQGTKKEAQAMTVDVSLGALPAAPLAMSGSPNIVNRPYAEIEFGSDGNRTKVRVDVATGKRLTVVGNYISVIVGMGDVPPDSPGVTNVSSQLTVGASIGTFAATSACPVVRTVFVDQVASGASTAPIQIPTRAGFLLPVSACEGFGAGAFAFDIFLLTQFGLVAMKLPYTATYPATDINYPFPITDDMAFFIIANHHVGPVPVNFALPFQLSL